MKLTGILKYQKDAFLLLLIVVLSFFLLLKNINKPFWGHHDWNSNTWSVIARNNIKYGFFCTKFGQATTSSPIKNCNELSFYMNHPPFITWLLTLSYYLFGFSEAAGRLPFIIFSTGSVVLVYLISKKVFSRLVGFLASLYLMFTPMFQYFAKSINHEPVVLFIILLGFYSYLLWIKDKKKKFFYWFLFSAFLTGFSGWHGYLFYLILLGLTLIFAKNKLKKTSVSILILFFTFSLHFLHQAWLSGSFSLQLFRQMLVRMSLTDSMVRFSFLDFLSQELTWLLIYFTSFLLVSAVLIFLKSLISLIKTRKLNYEKLFIFVFLVFGLSVPLVFRHQAFIHDYLNFYLLPYFSISAALITVSLKRVLPKKVFLITCLVLLFLVFVERKTFLGDLQAGSANKQYVDLAKEINKRAKKETKFLLEATNFYNFAHPFLNNYAYGIYLTSRTDDLDSFNNRLPETEASFDYIVTVDTNPVENNFIKFLEERFKKEKVNGFNFYKVKSSIN